MAFSKEEAEALQARVKEKAKPIIRESMATPFTRNWESRVRVWLAHRCDPLQKVRMVEGWPTGKCQHPKGQGHRC